MTETVDCLVIGAGVVGLACARAIAQRGREVLVLERNGAIGAETSSRNSEVIHAGIYYPTGSMKARTCVAGKRMLYAYCDQHGVAHRRCGKIIVATTEAECAQLDRYRVQAAANGVDLRLLDAAEVRAREPAVAAVAGLWSESTGIIDSHAFMLALQGDLEAHGGMIAFASPVTALERDDPAVRVVTETLTLRSRWVVNSAGPWAPDLARMLVPDTPAARFARGHYYVYSGRAPFTHLVYPVPEPGGLGVHVTLDLAGQARFGPDVQWVSGVDYRFDDSRREQFVAAIRRYFPGLEPERLQPGYTGVRPKLAVAGPDDFVIDGPPRHGVPGLVNLLGIESPGLTAALALAEDVADLAG